MSFISNGVRSFWPTTPLSIKNCLPSRRTDVQKLLHVLVCVFFWASMQWHSAFDLPYTLDFVFHFTLTPALVKHRSRKLLCSCYRFSAGIDHRSWKMKVLIKRTYIRIVPSSILPLYLGYTNTDGCFTGLKAPSLPFSVLCTHTSKLKNEFPRAHATSTCGPCCWPAYAYIRSPISLLNILLSWCGRILEATFRRGASLLAPAKRACFPSVSFRAFFIENECKMSDRKSIWSTAAVSS